MSQSTFLATSTPSQVQPDIAVPTVQEECEQTGLQAQELPQFIVSIMPLATDVACPPTPSSYTYCVPKGNTISGSHQWTSDHVDQPQQPMIAIDSHFHLDRTREQLWGASSQANSDDLIGRQTTPVPNHPVHVMGGVEVYCDPNTYPIQSNVNPYWKMAVGIHPSWCIN